MDHNASGLGNHSFAHCSFLLFSKEWLSDCLLIRSFKKSKWAIALFSLFSKELPKERSLFQKEWQKEQSLFQKEQWKERSLFQKERKSENEQKMSNFPNRSFFAQKKERLLIFKMSKWTALAAGLGNCSFAHFHSFQKSDWAIALFVALCKRANERLLFFCSFQKSNEKSDCSFALSKRATKRAIAHSLFQKEQKSKNEQKMSNFPNHSFFFKKRVIAHFQNERMPNPGFK